MTPARIPNPDECPLCNGTEEVQLLHSPVGDLFPCPRCRMQIYTVTMEMTEAELKLMDGRQEFIEALKHNLRDRLLNDLIDNVAETTVEFDVHEKKHVFTAKLTVIHPRKESA